MSVSLTKLPAVLAQKIIASADTNPIPLVVAAVGKTVKLWGLVVAGGTSILFSSNATALSGVMTTTGLALPTPRGNSADCAYPHFESAVGETINITPGASGMNGIAYFTQD